MISEQTILQAAQLLGEACSTAVYWALREGKVLYDKSVVSGQRNPVSMRSQ